MISVVLLLFRFHLTLAGTHSMEHFCTVVFRDIDNQTLTVVGMIDGQQFMYFDSNTMKAVPKTDWMRDFGGARYWDRETQAVIDKYREHKIIMKKVLDLYNQSTSKDVQIFQMMFGCEQDDNGTTRGYLQYGYNGEDFISFDRNTLKLTAGVMYPEANSIKNQWDGNIAHTTYWNNYLNIICFERMKEIVSHGKDALDRKVAPVVSLLQNNSSSPVVCHATSFYPKNITMTWKKNNVDYYEDVEISETLPNEDGTFQRRISLSVKSEEWKKNPDVFRCVVQHEAEEISVLLNENNIKTSSASDSINVKSLVFSAVAVFVVGCILALLFIAVKKKLIVCRKQREANNLNSTAYMETRTTETD